MKWLLIFLVILLIPIISGLCEENQIDINSASAEELDEIKWVGPATAQNIIDKRPFNSIDDLIEVSRITETRLIEIKEQGLACVSGESKTEIKEEVIEEVVKEEIVVEKNEENKEPVDLKVIELNPKVIKTDNSGESYNVYAIFGLVTFSILLILLFMLKKLKTDKNEFDG